MKELPRRQKYSQAQKVEISTADQFLERITGVWWQLVRSEDEVKVSLFRIAADDETHTVEGDSFDREGHLIAHWRSVVSGVRAKDRIALYSWEGDHPATAPGNRRADSASELLFQSILYFSKAKCRCP